MREACTGSCLCRGVRFEISRPFCRAGRCHCSCCRKHSSTFGLIVVVVTGSNIDKELLARCRDEPGPFPA